MTVKKLSFYNDTAKITVRSDHLPLKKFLEKNTMNSKVNNLAVELESQNITFEYIPGIRNTLTDTLSRLIDINCSNTLNKKGRRIQMDTRVREMFSDTKGILETRTDTQIPRPPSKLHIVHRCIKVRLRWHAYTTQ